MVFGIPKTQGGERAARLMRDKNSISEVLQELHFDVPIDNIKCQRTGKYSPHLAHPRPLKLIFSSADKASSPIQTASQKRRLPTAYFSQKYLDHARPNRAPTTTEQAAEIGTDSGNEARKQPEHENNKNKRCLENNFTKNTCPTTSGQPVPVNEASVNHYPANTSPGFSIYYVNASGMNSKPSLIKFQSPLLEEDAIAFMETWLSTARHTDDLFFFFYVKLFEVYRSC